MLRPQMLRWACVGRTAGSRELPAVIHGACVGRDVALRLSFTMSRSRAATASCSLRNGLFPSLFTRCVLSRSIASVASTTPYSASVATVHDAKARGGGAARVLVFDGDGDPTVHAMTRAEVLRITQDAAFTEETVAPVVTKRSPRGESIIDVQRVHARDIRQLVSAFAVRSEPSVEVRDQAILVNADPIRAIIMRHRCLVFLRDDDLTMQPMLEDVFHEIAGYEDTSVAYEFKALEALLNALCRHYHGEFDRIAPGITTSLSRLAAGQPNTGELNTLRSFKNTINEFQSRVDGVRRALMATINNEEDLRLLYLTKLHSDRSLLGNIWSYDSEEAEVLIENYVQDIHALQTNAMLLQQRIQNTETVVKLRLDAMRNYLLGVNILFSVAGISLSLGTFTVGVFGMNLISGLEQAPGWFWGVTGFASALVVATGVATTRHFKRKGVFGSIRNTDEPINKQTSVDKKIAK